MKELVGLLNISRKAGRVLLGRTAVFEKARSGRFIFVLVACDAGSDLVRKIEGLNYAKIDLTSSDLGEIFGRDRLSVIGIIDEGLASGMRDLLKGNPGGESRPAGHNQIVK